MKQKYLKQEARGNKQEYFNQEYLKQEYPKQEPRTKNQEPRTKKQRKTPHRMYQTYLQYSTVPSKVKQ